MGRFCWDFAGFRATRREFVGVSEHSGGFWRILEELTVFRRILGDVSGFSGFAGFRWGVTGSCRIPGDSVEVSQDSSGLGGIAMRVSQDVARRRGILTGFRRILGDSGGSCRTLGDVLVFSGSAGFCRGSTGFRRNWGGSCRSFAGFCGVRGGLR